MTQIKSIKPVIPCLTRNLHEIASRCRLKEVTIKGNVTEMPSAFIKKNIF